MAGEVFIVSIPMPPDGGAYLTGFTCEITEVKQQIVRSTFEYLADAGLDGLQAK